jgi:ABC-type bacteriocin/lantibiotic exporter with double-glycine peptidase domain
MAKKSYYAPILHFLTDYKKEIRAIYVFSILSGLVELSLPLGVQTIIGLVMGAQMVTSIYVLIGLVTLGVFFSGKIQINQMKLIEKVQQKIFTQIAFEFGSKIPRFDLKKMDKSYLPEKVNRFFDTLNIQKGISKILLDIPIASIQIILGLLLLALYHPIFMALGLLLILILVIIFRITFQSGIATSLEESNYKYQVVAWFEEVARTIKSFKLGKINEISLRKTDQNVEKYLEARTKHFEILLIQFKSLITSKVLITFSMLSIGSYLLLNQQLNIGEFIASEIVILMVISAVSKLISSLDSLYDVLTGIEKVKLITDSPLEHSGNIPLERMEEGHQLEVRNLRFGFDETNLILRDINFNVLPNAKICISGGDGSGKSTLIRVLSGNYADFQGTILMNNIPIQNYNLISLREQIGVLLKQQDIFQGTLWENIELGRTGIKPADVIHLAKQLGFENFLEQFPNGFDTQLDPTGKKIPFTNTKKILLLRALVNAPKLLLMEEPWNDLGKDLKEKVMTYFLQLKNTTCIIISNDQDFALKCDQQLNLQNGTI